MNEEWRDIQGYEGLYQVSNLGRVRSLDRYVPHKTLGKKFCRGCIMATHINNAGYITVNLCKNNKYKSFDVHRLVATAFIVIDDINKVEVNHLDENKRNNHVYNLEWITKSGNNRYGTKTERAKRHLNVPILQYDSKGNFISEWNSATEAEKKISGKATGAISHCIKGKTKTAYGYIWRYKEVA